MRTTLICAAVLAGSSVAAVGQHWFGSPRLIDEGTILAHGDVNGDGSEDLIVRNGGVLFPLLNNGNGEFTLGPPSPMSPESTTNSGPARLGDVDGDGLLDLVMLAFSGPTIQGFHVYHGQIGSTFAFPTYVAGPAQPNAFNLGDFNADGRADIGMASFSAQTAGWIFWNGASFAASAFPSLGDAPLVPIAVDYTGDGRADLVVPKYDANAVILVPTVAGQPTLGPTLTLPAHDGTPGGVAGDVDGDGDLDVVVAMNDSIDLQVTVLINTGGTLSVGPSSAFANVGFEVYSEFMEVTDWDGDGDLDIGTQTPFNLFGQAKIRAFVLENTTGTRFDVIHEAPVRTPGWFAGFADLDLDGRSDLLASNAILFGDGTFDLGFGPPFTFVVLASTIVDFDEDGDLDVLQPLFAFLNDATGQFGPAIDLRPSAGAGFEFRGGVHGDFDNDGEPDLLVEKWQPSGSPFIPDVFIEMWRLERDGAGHYVAIGPAAPAGFLVAGGNGLAGDYDSDGDLDVLASNLIAVNQGNGFFSSALPALAGAALDQADVDGDGDVDVLTRSGSSLILHAQQAGGAFTSLTLFSQTGLDDSARFHDLEGDGDVDVVLSTTTSGFPFPDFYTIHLLENVGGGAFAAPITLDPGPVESDVYGVADVDGDGQLDLLAASETNVGGGTENLAYGLIDVFIRIGPGLSYEPRRTWIGHRNGAFADIDADGDVDVIGQDVIRGRRFNHPDAGRIRQFGAGVAGTGGAVPLLGAQGPAKFGSTTFELRLRRAVGGAVTLFAIGTQEIDVPNAPAPDMHFYVGGTTAFFAFALPGVGGQTAAGELTAPVPVLPVLVGQQFFVQMIHVDAGAPFGLSSTNGLELRFGS